MRALQRHFVTLFYGTVNYDAVGDITLNPNGSFKGRIIHDSRIFIADDGTQKQSDAQLETFFPVTNNMIIFTEPVTAQTVPSQGQRVMHVSSAASLSERGLVRYEAYL